MEVTIDCPCGETYVFDIDPVDGKMPTEVNCPTCGADGTELSNQFIAEHSRVASPPPGLRLQTQAPPEPDRLETEIPPPIQEAPSRLTQEAPPPAFLLGSIGAVVAGLIGMGAWYLLIIVTEYEIGIAAWGIGVLIGLSTRALAKGGSQPLAMVAGACALVAIIGGQVLVVKTFMDEFWNFDDWIEVAYDERMEFAQKALAATNDEELRAVLMEDYLDDEVEYYAIEFSDEELAEFRRDELPELRDFVNGIPSREEYEQELREFFDSASLWGFGLLGVFSWYTLLWLFLGVGSAYKIAGNAED